MLIPEVEDRSTTRSLPPLQPMRAHSSGRCRRCRKWFAPEELVLARPTKWWKSTAMHLDVATCAAAAPDVVLPPFTGDRQAEIEAVGQLIAAHPWTVARTMPDIPHQWSLRRQWADGEAFTRVARAIQLLGHPRRWRTQTSLYLDVHDEHLYWVTTIRRCPPPHYVNLINRARIDDPQPALPLEGKAR